MAARLAIFVSETGGAERVVPAGNGIAATEAAMRLYETLRDEVERFDRAVRQRLDPVNALLDLVPPPATDVN